MADTILQAFRMSQAERSARMKRMRHVVRKENVFWWVDSFLRAGAKIASRSLRGLGKRRRSAALNTFRKTGQHQDRPLDTKKAIV